jgi:uncharacterized protein (TIGR02145 family)
MADFPTAKTEAVDNVTDVLGKHINNLEDKVGIDSSADTDSLDYRIGAVEDDLPTGDIVGTTDTQTLTNKTLTSPKLNEDVAVTITASQLNGLTTGWVPAGETWTYASVSDPIGNFTISGDFTKKYFRDMPIVFDCDGDTIYGKVLEVSYGGGNTTVKFMHQCAQASKSAVNLISANTITNNKISYTENPAGYPAQEDFPYQDVRDDEIYSLVQIGNQLWMAENMRWLPFVVGPDTGGENDPYAYIYGYDGTDTSAAKSHTEGTENVYETYGALYNFPMGLVVPPQGFKTPSDTDWMQLELELGMSESEIYDSGVWRNTGPVGSALSNDTDGGNNSSGFTALLGGYRGTVGTFVYLGAYALFWSSSPSSGNAFRRYLNSTEARVSRYASDQAYGFSVRCLRDN